MMITAADYRSAFQYCPGCSLLIVPDLASQKVISVTNDFLKMKSTEANEVIDGSLMDVLKKFATIDRQLELQLLSSLDHVIRTRETTHFYRTKDANNGSDELTILVFIRPVLDPHGALLYISYSEDDVSGFNNNGLSAVNGQQTLNKDVLRDSAIQDKSFQSNIEDLKRSQLLEAILQNTSNGISVSEAIRNEEGRIIDARTILVNDAAVALTGLQKDIYTTATACELDPNMFETAYGKACVQAVATGEPFEMEYFVPHTGKWLELSVSRLDENRLIHIFTDLSEARQSRIELQNSNEQLKRVIENLEEFAYVASHDLKEPLRKLYFYTDRLRQELVGLTDDQKALFDRLLFSTRKMAMLVDELLEFARDTSEDSERELIDLNKKLEQVLEDFELDIEEKSAKILVGSLPTVKGHRRQMQQLFYNLISNALKYNRPGVQPEITINCSLLSAKEALQQFQLTANGSDFFLFEVADNGVGFDQTEAHRIFKVFTRLENSHELPGSGVGLAIVQKIIRNHNGIIYAESKPGHGTKFVFLLPKEN